MISVVIPAYNAERFIVEAIESCLVQEEVSQIIVVDDGSTDDTKSKILSHFENETRLELICHETNKGVSESRNIGMQAVKSEFLSFLDADDYYAPNRFTQSVKLLREDTSLDGVYMDIKSFGIDINTNSNRPDITTKSDIPPSHLKYHIFADNESYFSIVSLLLRSKKLIYSRIKFDTNLTMYEDKEFIYELVLRFKLTKSDEVDKYYRRIHDENATIRHDSLASTYLGKVLDKWILTRSTALLNLRLYLILFNRWISFKYVSLGWNLILPVRILIKSIISFIQIILHPSVLIKIIKLIYVSVRIR